VVLIDIDPGYFPKEENYVPQARKILERHKLDWPNIFTKSLQDTVHTFNLTGYGNIVVDAKGIVRGIDLRGDELERVIQTVVEGK
jgi:hypothetical protein